MSGTDAVAGDAETKAQNEPRMSALPASAGRFRFPTAILATGLGILASLSFTCGLILDNVTRGRQEARRMAYLAIPAWEPPATPPAPPTPG